MHIQGLAIKNPDCFYDTLSFIHAQRLLWSRPLLEADRVSELRRNNAECKRNNELIAVLTLLKSLKMILISSKT
jgi:hypothetical protein